MPRWLIAVSALLIGAAPDETIYPSAEQQAILAATADLIEARYVDAMRGTAIARALRRETPR